MKITELIKGKTAIFVEFHSGNLFYEIDGKFRFPVPVEELKGSYVKSEEKAATFFKWIRKTLAEINKNGGNN